jgi:stage IV sporulation protein A
MPGWISMLEKGHPVKQAVFSAIRCAAEDLHTVRDAAGLAGPICGCEYVTRAESTAIDLGSGTVTIAVTLDGSLFFDILSEETGLEIRDEGSLLEILKDLCAVKKSYARLEPALREVEATGYGIVMPETDELHLEEPEIIRQGGKYGVRLKASAPSIHMMKAGITTTVSPIVGTEKQSEELVMYLLQGFEEDPARIWESNIFGKSLHELVNEGLHSKLFKMPVEARLKLQETLERIINEGCSGLICFIL